jgi:hypothetical protein
MVLVLDGVTEGAIMPTLIRTWRTMGMPAAMVDRMAASTPLPPLGPAIRGDVQQPGIQPRAWRDATH